MCREWRIINKHASTGCTLVFSASVRVVDFPSHNHRGPQLIVTFSSLYCVYAFHVQNESLKRHFRTFCPSCLSLLPCRCHCHCWEWPSLSRVVSRGTLVKSLRTRFNYTVSAWLSKKIYDERLCVRVWKIDWIRTPANHRTGARSLYTEDRGLPRWGTVSSGSDGGRRPARRLRDVHRRCRGCSPTSSRRQSTRAWAPVPTPSTPSWLTNREHRILAPPSSCLEITRMLLDSQLSRSGKLDKA